MGHYGEYFRKYQVQKLCSQWAEECRGGLGMGRMNGTLDTTVRSTAPISDMSVKIDTIIAGMEKTTLQRAMKLHYLNDHSYLMGGRVMNISKTRFAQLIYQAHDIIGDALGYVK